MAAEGFLSRWSRLKARPEEAPVEEPVVPVAVEAGGTGPAGLSPAVNSPEELPPPSLADAAALTSDSDFSLFVAKNVDAAVRRLAMKKLFADPHFHGHDGLDIYMGDYTIPSPVSAEMLADMSHNKGLFARLDDVIEQVDTMLAVPENSAASAAADTDAAAASAPAAADATAPPPDTPEPPAPVPPAPPQDLA